MSETEREYPDYKIERSVESWSGWTGWIGEKWHEAILALRWKAGQGDELPAELEALRDAMARFGHAPIEEAYQRIQGLEKAFADIKKLMSFGQFEEIEEIVRRCVEYSGAFGEYVDPWGPEKVGTDPPEGGEGSG